MTPACWTLLLLLLLLLVSFVLFAAFFHARKRRRGAEALCPWAAYSAVYYINLDSRPDRRQEIESELRKLQVPPSKVVRIPGVVEKFGQLGCAKAHVRALEHARDHHPKGLVLVMEDDFELLDATQAPQALQRLRQRQLDTDWDVLMLAANLNLGGSEDPKTGRVYKALTASAYVIGPGYREKLLRNFTEAARRLSEAGPGVIEFYVDVYWHRLQDTDRFKLLRIGKQRPSYSDIELKDVDYQV